MRNGKLIGFKIIFYAVIGLTLLSGSVAGNYKKDYTVVSGNIKWEKIEPSNEKVWLNISVQDQTNTIDVYIMRLSDFSPNRYLRDNFSVPALPWFHNITQTNEFTFDPPDDEDYIVIMDNSDNALENDTVPEDDVIVELNIKYKRSEKPMTVKGIIISIIAILFVYYTLFLYFKRKKEIADKKKRGGNEHNEQKS